MAISEPYAGSQSVTTTEWSLTGDDDSLASITDDGVYQFFLDVNAIVGADLFRFRIYEKVQSGDTQRVVYEAFLGGPQGTPIFVSPALVLIHGWDASLLRIAGSDRTITWSIRKIA
jgi:hypothetical protein